MTEKITFSFGKNWQNYLKFLSKERLETAKNSLTNFLKMKDLEGKTFLDIGCGSGIFSYAAYELGAEKIVSFDIDPYSVLCCKYLHKLNNKPNNWVIFESSILNNDLSFELDKYDIVHSWGVLHHTGQMWRAIKNATNFVKYNGYFYFTIYNKVDGFKGSNFWLKIKKLYNSSPRILKLAIEILFILNDIAGFSIRFKNPIKVISTYKERRGMDYRVDIIDWLGGYPYEFATVREILKFMKKNFPNFNIINIKQRHDLGNNWYLFKKIGN